MMFPPQMMSGQQPLASSKNTIDAKLFIGQIPKQKTQVDIFQVFSKMGTCKIDLMNNPMRLYQSAIISYDARDQALAAMDKFRQEKVFDKYLMILGYETDRTKLFSNEGNVFIKGIPKAYDFQMDKFYKRMREIGEIYSFKVGLNSEGKATGYAFVKFKNPQDAIKLEEQGEIKFIEDKLTVQKFEPKQNQAETRGTANLYVKNFKQTLIDEDLKNFFEQYGQLVSVALKQGPNGKIGFICFKTQEDAQKAIQELNGKYNSDLCQDCSNQQEVKKNLLYVQPHQRKELRELNKLRQLEIFKRQWQRHNLYVKHIPLDWTEDRLAQEFKQFGNLKSYKIVKKQQTGGLSSTGVGYVCFEDLQGAQTALDHFKERQNGNQLYVSSFQSKQTRQKKLQKKYQTQQSSVEQFLKLLMGMLNPRVGPNQQIMPPANPRMYQGMMQNMMPRQGFNMHGNNNVRGRNNMNRGFQRGGMNRGGRQPHNASHMPQGPPPSMPSNNGNQPQNGMVPPAVAPPQQPRHGMVPPPQQPNPMMISGQEMQNHQQQLRIQAHQQLQEQQYQQQMAQQQQQQMQQQQPLFQQQSGIQQQQPQPQPISQAPGYRIDLELYAQNIQKIKDIIGNSQALDNAQKQEVGEQIYNIFINYDQEYTPKVTGMLLEIEPAMLKKVIGNPDQLKQLFQQAVDMLKMQQLQQQLQQQQLLQQQQQQPQ